MTHKELAIRYEILNYFVGCVYWVLNTTVPNKVKDIDLTLQEIIDDRLDEDTSGELAEQHMRVLKEALLDAMGCHAIHLSEAAHEELRKRSEAREGLTPSYTEVDL